MFRRNFTTNIQYSTEILSPHPFVHCTLVRQRTFKISPLHSYHVKPSWSLTDTAREMRFCRSLGLGLYCKPLIILFFCLCPLDSCEPADTPLPRKVSSILGILDEYPCMDVCLDLGLISTCDINDSFNSCALQLLFTRTCLLQSQNGYIHT